MANLNYLISHVLKWECGATQSQIWQFPNPGDLFDAVKITKNNVHDLGGWTNSGITLDTWKRLGYDNDGDGHRDLADLRAMTYEQWYSIIKRGYWDRAQADSMLNQSVANMIVDFMITSGGAPRVVQRTVGVRADGIIGPRTIAAINAQPADILFSRLTSARLHYYRRLPTWCRFGNGWTRRVRDIKFDRRASR